MRADETLPPDQVAAAEALRAIARDEELKAFVLENEVIYGRLLRAALRFVGGETLEACLDVAHDLNESGHAVTIDHMGESTRDVPTANEATAEFLRAVDAIDEHGLHASISLDLSHVGLATDDELGVENARRIADAAREADTEVLINMEGTERTDRILSAHARLVHEFPNVGITIQAYLHRTDDDLPEVLARPGRIRLVKGAYEEPPEAIRTQGEAVDAAFRTYAEALLDRDGPCTIATHDPALLDHVHGYVRRHDLDPDGVEFSMLYGVTPERLELVRDRGYDTRMYLPYGTEWYLYLCHRIAEHPPNLYRAIADAVGAEAAG